MRGIGDEGGKKTEVEDVTSQRQQSSIGKKQRLHHQHRCNGKKGRVRPEQNRQNKTAAKMAAGTGYRDREVDHLGRKNESAQNPHKGNLAVINLGADFAGAVGDRPGRRSPHRSTNRR